VPWISHRTAAAALSPTKTHRGWQRAKETGWTVDPGAIPRTLACSLSPPVTHALPMRAWIAP